MMPATDQSKADDDTDTEKNPFHPPKEGETETGTGESEKPPKFGWPEWILTFGSIIMYIADSYSDFKLALDYYDGEFFGYCWLTVGFVVGPAIVVTIFNFILYMNDDKKSGPWHKVLKWVFNILTLGPIFRDFNVIYYGWKGRRGMKQTSSPEHDENQKKHYEDMISEQGSSSFLRLFERFLEAAPQATLQIFIWLHHIGDHNPILDSTLQRITTVLISLVSMAFSLTTFNKTARLTWRPAATTETEKTGKKETKKEKLRFWESVVQFAWNFCMISSRICSLAFFTAAYGLWILPVFTIHWLVMFIWLVYLGRKEYNLRIFRIITSKSFIWNILAYIKTVFMVFFFAFVHIFVCFNTLDGPTKLKYSLCYGIFMAENLIFTLLSLDNLCQFEFACIVWASYFLFFIGLIFMFCYFTWFHPSLKSEYSKQCTMCFFKLVGSWAKASGP